LLGLAMEIPGHLHMMIREAGCDTCEDTTTGKFDLFGVDLGFGWQTVGVILRRFSAVFIVIYVHGHDLLLGSAYAG
jgi:hypothetical protein